MEKIFWLVLELSYAGSWVIAAVMFLRCLLHRLPKKFSYILWVIPGIRLLFPVSFHGIWGLIGNWDAADNGFIIPHIVKEAQNAVNAGKGNNGLGLAKEVFAGMQSESFVLDVSGQAVIVWAAGTVLLAGYGLLSIIRIKRKLCISVRWKENIYLADGILTPFVFAGFPDKIYLPSSLKKEEYRYILLHEQFHIKRKDSLFKLIAFLILCIHWFNPMVWIGVSFFNRDMEMSCDEAVVSKLDGNEKKEYAKELLRFSVNPGKWLRFSVRFGEKGVKGRIMNLFQRKSKSKGALILGTALVVMAGTVLIPDFLGQDLVNTASGETKAEKNVKERLTELMETTGREYGYPTKFYEYSEDGKVTEEYEVGYAESEMDGVTAQFLWLKEQMEQSGDAKGHLEKLAKMAGEDFKKEYPDCDVKNLSYHFQLSKQITALSSANGEKEALQLEVLLPEDWREKEAYSDMDSRKQTVNWILVKSKEGEWRTLDWCWGNLG